MNNTHCGNRIEKQSVFRLVGCLTIVASLIGCVTPTASAALQEQNNETITSIVTPEEINPPVATDDVVVSTPEKSIPPLWDLLSDDFEEGTLSKWNEISAENVNLAPQKGRNGSTALEMKVHKRETYLYRTDVMKATEGYVTFWFNPNHVEIEDQPDVPIPGKSIRIVDIKGLENYHLVAGLRIWKPAASGDSYKACLEWEEKDGSHFDLDAGQITLKDGWQKVTLAFKINTWIAVWVDDVLVREVAPIQHVEPFGEILELGKTNDDSVVIPIGSMLYDDVTLGIPKITDLWVDAAGGNDNNKGFSRNQALQTIQKAADLAGPGTTVHILPGVYRESIDPAKNGSNEELVTYLAEDGPGTVVIRGSVSSNSIQWTRLAVNSIGLPPGVDPSAIYIADLSSWKLEDAPRFVVEMDDSGKVINRLPLAREPDWQVETAWRQQEFWWTADGGAYKAGCDPSTNVNKNCDQYSRSMTYLTDRSDDTSQVGIESGNLSTLGNLVGATLVAIDTVEGHYVYRRKIVSQDVQSGRIEVDRKCEFDEGSNDPGLGWGTRYFVEGKPNLLDSPGEWWYDTSTGWLYLWPNTPQDPASLNLEISVRDNGFRLSHRSNIQLDGIKLQFFNGNAVSDINDPETRSHNNVLRNVTLEYADHGILLSQNTGSDPENTIKGFTVEDSEIAYMDSDAINMIYTWPNDSSPDSFVFAGITDTTIRNNQLHDLGFRSDSDSSRGVLIQHGNGVIFENNHIYHVAHNGVQFAYAIDQSDKQYGFSSEEIKTGEILVSNNLFENTCELTTDCGGLKFWGDPPDSHVYRDVLITGNTFRNIIGWSSVAEKRGLWSSNSGSHIKGMGGFGLYVDMASGLQVFRNLAYNNAYADFFTYGVWRDGQMLFYNNVAANSSYGFRLGGLDFEKHGNVDTELVNNLMINNAVNGLWISENGKQPEGLTIDHNLYYENGWVESNPSQDSFSGAASVETRQGRITSFSSVAEMQANTSWEASGKEGDPGLTRFDLRNHDLFSVTTPDFHLTPGSMAADAGSQDLPTPLMSLLAKFGIADNRSGPAYDIGRFESGTATSYLDDALNINLISVPVAIWLP